MLLFATSSFQDGNYIHEKMGPIIQIIEVWIIEVQLYLELLKWAFFVSPCFTVSNEGSLRYTVRRIAFLKGMCSKLAS